MLVLQTYGKAATVVYRRSRTTRRCAPQFREPGREAGGFDLIPKQPNLEPVADRPLLNKAENDLARYCSNLEDEQEKQRCMQVHKYLHEQHEQLATGCKRELDQEGQPGKSCQNLEKLESMIRQVEGTKRELIKTIGVMQRLNEREATGSCDALLSQDAKETFEIARHYDELKERAAELFDHVDKNHDGRMDVAEFRDCMAHLSKALSGDEVMQIFTCLDAHGFISREQFIDVIVAEAERLEHPDSDAMLLRKLHVESSWWSERPASVDSL